jgi:hypothetical protein
LLYELAVRRTSGLDARDSTTATHDEEAFAPSLDRVEQLRKASRGVRRIEPSHEIRLSDLTGCSSSCASSPARPPLQL